MKKNQQKPQINLLKGYRFKGGRAKKSENRSTDIPLKNDGQGNTVIK